MRSSICTVLTLIPTLALSVMALPAPGGSLTVPATPEGMAMPAGYNIRTGEVAFRDGKGYIVLTGEGDCHYEWRQVCDWVGNPPHQVCHPQPEWVCYTATAYFRLPPTVHLDGSRVYFSSGGSRIEIGRVKTFLFWKWVELNANARIQASHTQAALQIEVPGKAPRSPVENFVKLHGQEPAMGLLVTFHPGISNEAAREAIQGAGYVGEFAAPNDWSARDHTRDSLGISLSRAEALKVLPLLQADKRILSVRPVPLLVSRGN